ncbi:MAG: 4'-phosphopantetheinyl transferase family protein [Thermodesulfovibrionales bacterium]
MNKERLVSGLWDHRMAMEHPSWKLNRSSGRTAFPIRVVRGLLGRPHLLIGEHEGPSVSFSEGGGKLWAALCADGSDIGIDAAGPDEFRGEYPFDRVFHPEELQHAVRMTDGAPEKAAALLWSVKEAVVKALGTAFHLVDPLQISVSPSEGGRQGADGWYTFAAGLSGKALTRFSMTAGRSLSARARAHGEMWLSIALLNGPADHE